MSTKAQSLRQSRTAPAKPAGARVQRFTRTERAAHWTQATSFLLLLISGFVLALPSFESFVGHRELLREVHLTSAFLFFFGPAVIALAGDRRSVALDVQAVDTWDADDLRWLIPFPVLRMFGVRTPPQGRFNAGQKLNAIFVVWSSLAFTVTGLFLWQNRRFDSNLVSNANTIHTALAYIALLAFLGHLFLATVYPKTRHAFRAITEGWVNVEWAEQHHAKWVRNLKPSLPAPAYDGLRTTVQLLLGGFACLFATRVYFFNLGANVTDKVTGRLYDVTAFPGAASIHPQTGIQVIDWVGFAYFLVCVVAWVAADRLRRLPAGSARASTTVAPTAPGARGAD